MKYIKLILLFYELFIPNNNKKRNFTNKFFISFFSWVSISKGMEITVTSDINWPCIYLQAFSYNLQNVIGTLKKCPLVPIFESHCTLFMWLLNNNTVSCVYGEIFTPVFFVPFALACNIYQRIEDWRIPISLNNFSLNTTVSQQIQIDGTTVESLKFMVVNFRGLLKFHTFMGT